MNTHDAIVGFLAGSTCKADVRQQQHKASLQRMVTSVDMKTDDVDKGTASALTPDQRVATRS